MPYQWPLDPEVLFAERYPQMVNTGLPVADVQAVRTAVTDMWRDEPGGWVYEWSRLASGYATDGRHDLAALGYGWAKFPVLADGAKRAALNRQIEQYELAAPDMPVDFQRRVLDVAYQGSKTPVPVHILAAPRLAADAPVLIVSGGVDSWKMDLHTVFVALAMNTGARVVAFDIPGTGESQVALTPDSTQLIDGLAAAARDLGDGRVVHVGISMGGYFSAYSGLAGVVDASVVCGGPVEATFAPGKPWEAGMADIVGNTLGFDRRPRPDALGDRLGALSLRPLLDQDDNTPMFVVNGADDIHVPQHDTLVFRGRRDTRVELIPETGHCAVTKFDQVMSKIVTWVTGQLEESK